MATVVHERIGAPVDVLRISWGGIWAGVLTVLGLMLFLTALGIAVGISVANPSNADAQAFGTGAAIWSGISLLIALFVGGMASTRLGLVFDKAAGAFEGALVWVLSFLVILWLASSGVQLVASGLSNLFGGVTKTISSATGATDLSSGDVDQMLARLNDPQTATTLSNLTGVPRDQVASTLSDVSQRVQAARSNPQQAAAEVRQGTQQLMDRAKQQLPAVAERAKSGATKAAWATFVAMLISLAAAIGGAMVGRNRSANRLARENVALHP